MEPVRIQGQGQGQPELKCGGKPATPRRVDRLVIVDGAEAWQLGARSACAYSGAQPLRAQWIGH